MAYTPMTLSKSGSAKLKGDVTLSAGTNVTLTQSAQNIAIAATGGGTFVRVATKVVGASNAQDTTDVDYLCTGSGDQSTINTAIGALPSTGGRIVLSDGLFTLSGAVVVNKSNVIIEGQGGGTTIQLANSTTANCVELGDGTNVYTHISVRNMVIDGNLANQTVGGHGIMVKRKVAHYVIEDNRIQNTYQANILDDNRDTDNDTYAKVLNNYLDTTKSGNTWSNFEGIGNYVTIEGNTCLSGDWAAIDAYNGTRGLIIANNTCKSVNGANTNGNIVNEKFAECSITGNVIVDPKVHAIFAKNPFTVIAGNVIKVTNNPTGAVIYGSSGASDMVISGNVVEVTSTNTAAVTAIQLDSLKSNIANNVLDFSSSQAHIGIFVNSAGQLNIGENILRTSQTSSTIGIKARTMEFSNITGVYFDGWDTSIDFSSGATGVAVSNCSIINPLTTAIDISTCTEISIVNCYFDTPTYGIRSTSDSFTSNIVISDNMFDTVGHEAITVRSGRYWSITGNTFSNCSGSGTAAILLETVTGTNFSNHNVISGNTMTGTGAAYNIRENSSNDGPTIVTSNVALGAGTAQISTQNASSDVSHNITT